MELELLRKVIADVLSVDPEEITPETTFVDDLGADSLDLYQVIMAIEEDLGIEVDNEQAERIVSVGDAIDVIKSLNAG